MVVAAFVALHLVDDRAHIGPRVSLDEPLCWVQGYCEGLVVVAVTLRLLVLEN